jgi:hypothetical protein
LQNDFERSATKFLIQGFNGQRKIDSSGGLLGFDCCVLDACRRLLQHNQPVSRLCAAKVALPLMTLNRHARLAHLLHNGEAETGARHPMASSPSACIMALGDDDQIPQIRMMH